MWGKDVRRRLRSTVLLAACGLAVAGGGAVALADDAPLMAGANCLGDQLGNTATATDGAVLRCLATGEGGFTWVPDTGAAGTIADLQKQGYTVNIDRVGDGPLSACKVLGVRNPITTTQTTGNPLGGPHTPGGVTTITVTRTISVSLDCTGG